ncbi:MAG: hypothetical protein AAB391_03155 [Patescibacteria group bacterium]
MNLTLRHFVGGFAGGATGILAFHFAGFWPMFAACLLGFIIGFWAPEIWKKLHEPRTAPSKVSNTWPRAAAWLSDLNQRGPNNWRRLGDGLGRVLSLLPRSCRWLRQSTENRLRTTDWIIGLAWVGFVLISTYHRLHQPDQDMSLLILGLWIMAILAASLGFIIGISLDTEKSKLGRLWSRSVLLFVATKTFIVTYVGTIFTLALSTFGVIWLVSFVLTPVLSMVATIGQALTRLPLLIARMSGKEAHWMGALVTLLVTSTTALLTKGKMGEQTVLLIALANGLASGLLSAGAYRLSLRIAASDRIHRFVKRNLDPENIWNLFNPTGKRLMDTVIKRLAWPVNAMTGEIAVK